MKRLILTIFLLLMPLIWGWAQKVVTEEQAISYLMSLSFEEKIDMVIEYISIKNAEPIIIQPEYFYVITNEKLSIFSNPESMNMSIHSLEYDITFPVIEFDFKQEYEFPLLEVGITAGATFLLTVFLTKIFGG